MFLSIKVFCKEFVQRFINDVACDVAFVTNKEATLVMKMQKN